MSGLRSLAALLVTTLALGATPALGKEIYLTVRRDFAPTERPEIDVHFQHAAPLEVRIYRPKDLDEFVASQMDLRRAWRRPRIEENAAHALATGLNDTRLDLDFVRAAAPPELRRSLAPKLGGAAFTPEKSRLREGPRTLVAAPEKMELVTELEMDLDADAARSAFDVPGFAWWSSAEGGLRMKTLALPKLPAGFYLVEVLQGDLEGQVVLAVNDLAVLLHQTDGAALVRVARRSGAPVANARVDVRDLAGRWIAKGTTNVDGVLSLPNVPAPDLVAVIREGADVAIVDTDFLSTVATFPDVYLYSDRPLYRPGDTVRFRGIRREPAGRITKLLGRAPKSARVSVVDLDGRVVANEVSVPLSPFGTFSGELPLGPAAQAGVFRVVARLDDVAHTGEVRVKDYVKPLFFLKVETEQETLRAGGTLDAAISAERYAGGVPREVRLSAQLFRVRAEAPAWVDDAGLGETGSVTTYGGDRGRSAAIVPYLVASEDDVALDEDGRARLALRLPAVLPGPRNADYAFLLKLTARDADETWASLSKSFSDRRSDVVAQAHATAVSVFAGEPATLAVRAVTPAGKPYPGAVGRVTFQLTPYGHAPESHASALTIGADGRASVPFPTSRPGRVQAFVTLKDREGRETTAEAVLVVASRVPGEPLVEVPGLTLLPERETYQPGETARALLLLPKGWGERGTDRGRLHVTLAGRGIHGSRVLRVDGLTALLEEPVLPRYGTALHALVSYADPERGWVERTLTFRIPPEGKRLAVKVSPKAPQVLPGNRQAVALRVTDASGRPVKAEVSVSVVDRAVLDLQPEFRPTLLAFFHPLERLNLMSFLSRDFQAYGAGERLAARFGSSHSMAASKPRKVPRENDTAYWNPAVVTNEDGLATVFFRLPANQTTWHVTAVAVDGRGRFGEGGADFSTNAPVTVALVTPPFLRAGDHAEARLVVGNREARAKHVSAVVVPPSGAVLAEPLELNERLEPKRDGVVRVPFTVPAGAASAPSSSWEVRLQVDEGVPSSLPFVFRALPSNTSRVHSRVLTAGEAFDATTHPAPETGGPPESLGEVSSVRIFATSRLAGTLLPSLVWLSAYPWGCVEQVTSASVPGLVLRDVLGKDVGLANEDDTVREEVRRSLESSSTGLARLRSLRNSDGSYVWWPGSGRGDADMTAYVLSLLATFDDPELLRGLEARRSAGWLRGKTPSLGSSRGVLLTYVEARLVALGLAPKDGTSAETALAFQAGWALAHGSFRDRAYVLLALKARGLEATPAFRLVTKDLLRSLAPAAQADPALLGGEGPGALAVAAHALAAYGRIEGDPSDFTLRLLGSFGGEHYGSTFETSQVLAHSRWLLQREIEGGARPPELRVLQNGREVPSEHVVRRTGLFGTEVKVAGAIARRGPIVVESDDRRASLRAVIESSAPYDERNGEAASVRVSGENGVSLSRSYHRLDAKTGQLTPLRGPVAVGDLVYVRLSFARPVPRSYAAATYYDLSDDVPAGFTVVAEDRMYDAAPFGLGLREARFVAREIRPERVRWVFAFNHAFMDEPAQTGYVMRAQHAGDFVSGVARLEDFYDETTRLQTPSTRLRIAAPSSRRRGR